MDNNASIDKAAIDANIARTVDKAALRKVRNLVDNFEIEERLHKAKQFNLMLLTIIVIVMIAVPAMYFTGASKGGAAKRADAKAAKTDCASRAVERQRTALEREFLATNPSIPGAELSRRLDSYNDMFLTAARRECGLLG